MKFAKIAATLIGVANAGMGLSIQGTSSAGHSTKKVTHTEKVTCGQYQHFQA
jgi:hypothetical protein